MSSPTMESLLAGSALLASTLFSGQALATSPLGALHSPRATTVGVMPAIAATPTVDIDVSGIFSYDEEGEAINIVTAEMLAPNAHVTGIGWDVQVEAFSPSWLSELTVSFGGTSLAWVYLTPGVGDDDPGPASYSSGGIVDLVGLGLDFNVDGDGMLVSEWFEGYDDLPGSADGQWISGTITVQYAVPEPETYGMMALGLGVVGFVARRRRKLP